MLKSKVRGIGIIATVFFFILLVMLYNLHFFQDLSFTPSNEAFVNPLMGWAPWATIEQSLQPHTLVYADLKWRDFEPREGVYDFDYFEMRNQLARWRAAGIRVVFRFVMDVPGREAHMDIPDWLYEQIEGQGDFYDVPYGKGFSPDYSHPILIEKHRQAISALGQRYGGDDFIAFIQLGSLGHWGEWHVRSDSTIRPLPEEAICDQYVQHYLTAFPNTHLLMRRPFNIAAREGLGLYNDMTADLKATQTWLEWITQGGDYSQTGELNALSPMPEGWQLAPIGGEQTGSMSDEEVYGQYLDQTIALLKASHTTFIGPGGPYNIPPSSSLQPGINRVLAAIGYRLAISKAHLPKWVWWGRHVSLRMDLSNTGIAPFYYEWPLAVIVLDEAGRQVEVIRLEADIRQALPGKPLHIRARLPIDELPDGIFTIAAAILDPQSGQPAVRFSVAEQPVQPMQMLGHFRLRRLF